MLNGKQQMERMVEQAKKRRARALELYDERDKEGDRKRTMEDVAKILGCNKQRASQLIQRARLEAQIP